MVIPCFSPISIPSVSLLKNLSCCALDHLLPSTITRNSNSGFVTIAVPQETLEDLEIPMISEAVFNNDKRGKGKGKARATEKKKSEGEPEYAIGVDYKHGRWCRHSTIQSSHHAFQSLMV